MGDQYPSSSPPRLEVLGDLLVEVEDYPVPSTTKPEAPHSWVPCLPHSSWWQYVAQVYGQDTPSIISDVPSPGTVWPQSVIGPTTRSPALSQSQISVKPPPLTFPPGNFDGSFGNQAWAITDAHARAGYGQTCAAVKYHSNSGKDLRRFDKIWTRIAHGTLEIVARLPRRCIIVPIAAKRIGDTKT
ncbi:hypothetical protein EDB83DRAFT_2318264 [Lactarius deliciosus]|nr:hypothetical protein EDB83DRAFT_2318264 [Lactarius deliciosus]